MIRVLCIDGGSMRGIIPALVLQNLADRLRNKGIGSGFHRLFDLMAGTSTEGLIALCLSLPAADPARPGGFTDVPALSIDDVVDLYEKRGQDIFPRSVFHKLRKLEQVFREKYKSGPVRKMPETKRLDLTPIFLSGTWPWRPPRLPPTSGSTARWRSAVKRTMRAPGPCGCSSGGLRTERIIMENDDTLNLAGSQAPRSRPASEAGKPFQKALEVGSSPRQSATGFSRQIATRDAARTVQAAKSWRSCADTAT